MKVIRFHLLGALILFIITGLSPIRGAEEIKNADNAIAKAFEFTGFDQLKNYPDSGQVKAQLVTIDDDRTPYVGQLITGKKIWQVSFVDIPMAAIGRPSIRAKNSTFDVFIDPTNGKLLKLSCRFSDVDFRIPGVDPPDESPTKKMLNESGDSVTMGVLPKEPGIGEKDPLLSEVGFKGLPDSTPIPFLEVFRHSCVEMTKSFRLEAIYMLQTTDDGAEAKALWKTWLYGFPEITRAPSTDPASQTSSDQAKPEEPTIYLFTVLITSDGRLGECLDSEKSQWGSFYGDLPPGGQRYNQFVKSGQGPRKPFTDDRSSIKMSINHPGKLLVIDPAARRTGMDPKTSTTYSEMPRVSYTEDSIETPDGLGMMVSRKYVVRRPMSGDYKLTVAGAGEGNYDLGVGFTDISQGIVGFNLSGIPLISGGVHNYILGLNRLSGSHTTLRGGFNGGGDEDADIDGLITYASITSDSTSLTAGAVEIPLVIIYGRSVNPKMFVATMNGSEISNLFSPRAGQKDVVTIPLTTGRNELVLTVTEVVDGATDTDRLVFHVE